MNLKDLFGVKKDQLLVSDIIKKFGEDLSYNKIIELLHLFSKKDQEKIIEAVYKKQHNFWNSPEVVRYYARIYPNSPFVPDHLNQFVNLISPENDEIIIDLGCGCGILIKELFERYPDKNFKVIGLDHSVKALRRARELNLNFNKEKIKLLDHDFRKGIPVPDRSVDKVISNWGIVYLYRNDLEKAFTEVHRILKSEGEFICAAVIKGGTLSPFRKTVIKGMGVHFLKKWRQVGLRQSLRLFSLILRKGLKIQKRLHTFFPMYSTEELSEMFRRTGFKIVKKEKSLMGASIIYVAWKV